MPLPAMPMKKGFRMEDKEMDTLQFINNSSSGIEFFFIPVYLTTFKCMTNQSAETDPQKKKPGPIRKFFRQLGPGLITGASDDDPSGIVTYSQAGAAYGLTTLWTALLTFPLMAAIQGICARIGARTSQGLVGVVRTHYPRWLLYMILCIGTPAIVFNIGADIAGMGAVGHLLMPQIPAQAFSLFFTLLLAFILIRYPYQKIVQGLKYLCLSLFVYLIVPFLQRADFSVILSSTFWPKISLQTDYLMVLVGLLGTTISPYLFFWQATMEAEVNLHMPVPKPVDAPRLREIRSDINWGMLFSNLVMYFIILTTGTVLYSAGIRNLQTVEEAAAALRPLAGELSYALFALGIIGTGLLAIPVLGSALSYMYGEAFEWSRGLDKKFGQAKAFYTILLLSLAVGLSLNYLGISPINALLYSAIGYGLSAPILIVLILHIGNNRKIMGEQKNGRWLNALGLFTLALMSAAAWALIRSWT
jgi:NRAMP (natural resistance-associated macrophage protein)-like metal ion transporter